MNILLVAATAFEIRPLTDKLPLTGRENASLSHHHFRNNVIDVLLPGVGMMVTAFHMGNQLATKSYDLAINAGIAGAFDPRLKIGTVVNVVEDCVAGLGAKGANQFLDLVDLGLLDPDEPPFHDGRLINDLLPPLKGLEKIPSVKGSTVNTMQGNRESSLSASRRITPDVETMEGAAFLYACLLRKTPCLQIRSISNYVEERDKSRWDVKLALTNLNKTLHEIITQTTI